MEKGKPKCIREKGKWKKGKPYYTYGLAVSSNTSMSVCVQYSKHRHIQDCNLAAGPAKYAASEYKATWYLLSRR